MNTDKTIKAGIERLRLGTLGEALGDVDAFLVGGAARSLAVGGEPGGDVDIAVDAELEPLLERVGTPARRHERFATATIALDDGRHADLARTRTETYPEAGALPVVAPAPIEADLARRDFTVNAIAIALNPPHRLLDPFGGVGDLRSRRLRALHRASFSDDPTRAIRAARYCARLDLSPDDETAALIAAADLNRVSGNRRTAELARLAAETDPAGGFRLLVEWGLVEIPESSLGLIESIDASLAHCRWEDLGAVRDAGALRVEAILIAAQGGDALDGARALAAHPPGLPSEAVALGDRTAPALLLVAAAAEGSWIERYVSEWAGVTLRIDGDDLLRAGIPAGPAVGRGLRGALAMKLDGELTGDPRAELDAALRIARESI